MARNFSYQNGKQWDMTARKVVHYDNTYGDDYDAYAGHGTHVAGSV